MDNVLKNIKTYRLEKGLSHENMAHELNLSQVAYSKLEKNDTKLTVERLYKIADILKVDVAKLLDIDYKSQLNQTNNENSTGYLQQIDNFYQENKEQYEKIISLYEARLKDKDNIINLLQSKVV